MTNSFMWHDSCPDAGEHITSHFHVRHNSFICVTWLIRIFVTSLSCMCDMTHAQALVSIWRVVFMRDMTPLYVCVTWLIHICVIWLIHIFDMTHLYVRHDSCTGAGQHITSCFHHPTHGLFFVLVSSHFFDFIFWDFPTHVKKKFASSYTWAILCTCK